MKIDLTFPEIYLASCVGIRRRLDSIKKALAGKFGFDGEVWATDIEGAIAELAVAKSLNLYWSAGVGTFKLPDVGDLQVRSTKHVDGSLIVRAEDKDEDIFVLVVGQCPDYQVMGWVRGKGAKKDEWLKSPNGRPAAWFVPQNCLRPIGELKK